jgi:hypothetical protein
LRGRFIPAKACFELEVAGHGVDHRRWHQRRAGIIEVDQLRDSGRIGAQLFNVQSTNSLINPPAGHGSVA